MVLTMSETQFHHNEAMFTQHDSIDYTPGLAATDDSARRRVGVASITYTDIYYEGGFSSTGTFSYGVASMIKIDGASPDEPDAFWNVTVTRATWADHTAWWSPFVGMCKIVILSRFVRSPSR